MPAPEVNLDPSALDLEPIRLPSWAVSLIVIFVVPLGTAFLTDQDWKPVAAGALAAVVPLLVVSERARSKVVPVVTHDNDIAITQALGYASTIAAKAQGVQEGADAAMAEIAANDEAAARAASVVEHQATALERDTDAAVGAAVRRAPAKKATKKATAKKAAPRKAR